MSARIFAVGGAVRDHFLSRPSNDLDFVVEVQDFESALQEVQARGGKVVATFPQLLTFKAHIKWVVFSEEFRGVCDFALPRAEASYTDSRHPDRVEIASSIETDLSRRDFTVNAIAVDIDTRKVVDPFGGRDDLRERVLRAVGEPEERFLEDPTRVFRAMRFWLSRGLSIEDATLNAMTAPAVLGRLSELPEGRINAELLKLSKSVGPIPFMRCMREFRAVFEAVFKAHPDMWLRPQLGKRTTR